MKNNFFRMIGAFGLAIFGFITTISSGGGGDDDSPPGPIDPNYNNTPPVVNPVYLSVDPSSPELEINLIASDAEGDTLQYELMAADNGLGYTLAYIDPFAPILYVTLEPNFSGSITLPYRATDGYLFSETVNVTLQVGSTTEEEFGLGLIPVDPKIYTSFSNSQLGGELFGAPGAAPTLPRSIDLSSNFPLPGNQALQGSCTAWASAYALKSYQERLEMGWSLETSDHIFSPAFVYNQINGGEDRGAQIYDALQLIVDQGAATLTTMPYNPYDFRSQPSSQARQEAANYKAVDWERTNDTQSIKANLANRSPVVGGISVYGSLQDRNFAGVYNSTAGGFQGLHAITIVGYDDEKYGGAFKIINSWGSNWGEGGYFWLPYVFANSAQSTPFGIRTVLSESYILKDADNIGPNPTPNPTPGNNLPNLQVQDWSATYDPKPGGEGELQYRIINTGEGTAPQGFNVTLMLSKDTVINSNDIYVVYEPIPFELATGESVYRDQTNLISFNFPAYIQAGVYYMAMWVDDLNTVRESNENDNFSSGEETVTIANQLSDLRIESWYAEWDDFSGNGTLEYTVRNGGSGSAPSGWWIGFFLTQNEVVAQNNYLLFAEQINFGLIANDEISGQGNFNLFTDVFGNQIVAGTYDMYVWVDYSGEVNESNESNNYSFGNSLITLGYGLGSSNLSILSHSPTNSKIAYNGKPLPKKVTPLKMQIMDKPDGTRQIQFLGDAATDKPIFDKQNHANNQVIFPLSQSIPMPNLTKRLP